MLVEIEANGTNRIKPKASSGFWNCDNGCGGFRLVYLHDDMESKKEAMEQTRSTDVPAGVYWPATQLLAILVSLCSRNLSTIQADRVRVIRET